MRTVKNWRLRGKNSCALSKIDALELKFGGNDCNSSTAAVSIDEILFKSIDFLNSKNFIIITSLMSSLGCTDAGEALRMEQE